MAWWDEEKDGSIAQIYTIIQAQSKFTWKLIYHADSQTLWTLVDGPYGKAVEIGEYGNVLLFASSISIAAQVLYVKEHLKGLKAHTAWMWSVTLVWQLKHEGTLLSPLSLLAELNENIDDVTWVHNWMSHALDEDWGHHVTRTLFFIPQAQLIVSKCYTLNSIFLETFLAGRYMRKERVMMAEWNSFITNQRLKIWSAWSWPGKRVSSWL